MKLKIYDWHVCYRSQDPYTPPECRGTAVCGFVEAHPELGDCTKKKITTSQIVLINGRTVTTESGNVYVLGRVSSKYRVWLKKEGRAYDPKQPIKFV